MNIVTHKFLSMYFFLFLTLYMLRAHRAHHQDRQIVSIQLLVAVGGRVVCRSEVNWLYTHNLSLLMMSTMCSKHVEN